MDSNAYEKPVRRLHRHGGTQSGLLPPQGGLISRLSAIAALKALHHDFHKAVGLAQDFRRRADPLVFPPIGEGG